MRFSRISRCCWIEIPTRDSEFYWSRKIITKSWNCSPERIYCNASSKYKSSWGHVNGRRYVVENMTPNLFLTIVSGFKTVVRLILPRMNCTAVKDGFPIPGFRWYQFPIRVCFAMTIIEAQGQSIPAILGIDLCAQCFSHRQLYLTLSRTSDPRNFFILTTDGSNETSLFLFSEVFYVKRNIPTFHKSGEPKNWLHNKDKKWDIHCEFA